MNLVLIDNNFFKLTAAEAKALSVENRLPRPGYEIKADLAKLATVKFGQLSCFESRGKVRSSFEAFEHCKAENIKAAWIKRTPLSYWRGRKIKTNMVWALQVLWK